MAPAVALAGSMCLATSWPAWATEPFLLKCDRHQGEQEFEIYIDPENGYVLYNAQVRDAGAYERHRTYDLVGNEEEGTVLIDDGLSISTNNKYVLRANDESATFLLAKDSWTYGYAWTSVLPPGNERALSAFANHHEGECAIIPEASNGRRRESSARE